MTLYNYINMNLKSSFFKKYFFKYAVAVIFIVLANNVW